MINDILSTVRHLLNEGSGFNQADEALAVYRQLLHIFGSIDPSRIMKAEHSPFNKSDDDDRIVYRFSRDFPAYGDLQLAIVPKDADGGRAHGSLEINYGKGEGSFRGGAHRINIYSNMHTVKDIARFFADMSDSGTLQYVLMDKMSTFIHEFTHYLDTKRIPLPVWKKSASGDYAQNAIGDKRYSADNKETNAVYNQIASNFLHIAQNELYITSEKYDEIGKTALEFIANAMRYVKRSNMKHFVNNMLPKDLRSFKKRLYALYPELVQEIKQSPNMDGE